MVRGGATGSSKEHTLESLATGGAEVQKGMPAQNVKFNTYSVALR